MNRIEIATIAHWTLQRREFDAGHHDYIIQADDRRLLVNLYVEDHVDFKAERTTYTVTATPVSRQLDYDEFVEFAALVQKAAAVAYSFQNMIVAAEL